MGAKHTPGLLVIDPVGLRLIRQGDREVLFEVSDTSSVPLDELLADLARISALWNTFVQNDEPTEFVLALQDANSDLLDALERIAKEADAPRKFWSQRIGEIAHAAIAKARGEAA